MSLSLSLSPTTGHINNLYNTTFWAMVQRKGMTEQQAESKLKVRVCVSVWFVTVRHHV
jgi:tRNA(His) 5'-end guanylyltransferase